MILSSNKRMVEVGDTVTIHPKDDMGTVVATTTTHATVRYPIRPTSSITIEHSFPFYQLRYVMGPRDISDWGCGPCANHEHDETDEAEELALLVHKQSQTPEDHGCGCT